jgi:predicted small lipoprotein YifL
MRHALVILLVALAVAGCGRRGAPNHPPLPAGVAAVPENPDVPGSRKVPDRRFILDPLVD